MLLSEWYLNERKKKFEQIHTIVLCKELYHLVIHFCAYHACCNWKIISWRVKPYPTLGYPSHGYPLLPLCPFIITVQILSYLLELFAYWQNITKYLNTKWLLIPNWINQIICQCVLKQKSLSSPIIDYNGEFKTCKVWPMYISEVRIKNFLSNFFFSNFFASKSRSRDSQN